MTVGIVYHYPPEVLTSWNYQREWILYLASCHLYRLYNVELRNRDVDAG